MPDNEMTRRTLPVSIARNNDLIHTSQVAIQRKNAGPLLRVSPPTVAVKSCGLEREVGSNLDIPRFPLSSRSAERPAIEIRVDAVQVPGLEDAVQVILAAVWSAIAPDVRIIQVIAIRVVVAAIGVQADELAGGVLYRDEGIVEIGRAHV